MISVRNEPFLKSLSLFIRNSGLFECDPIQLQQAVCLYYRKIKKSLFLQNFPKKKTLFIFFSNYL